MDKNTILGLVLMVVVVLLFSWWMQPSPEQLEAQRRYNDSIAAVEAEQMARAEAAAPAQTDTLSPEMADSLKQVGLVAQFGEFAPCAEGTEEFTTLSNNKVTLKFSNKGGRLYEAVLNDYMAYDSTQVTLFTGNENDYGFIVRTNARVIDTRDLYFEPVVNDSTVDMTLTLANGTPAGYPLHLARRQLYAQDGHLAEGYGPGHPLERGLLGFHLGPDDASSGAGTYVRGA